MLHYQAAKSEKAIRYTWRSGLANSSSAATSQAYVMLHTQLLVSLVLCFLLLLFVHTYTFSLTHAFVHLIIDLVQPFAHVSHHAGCGYCHVPP